MITKKLVFDHRGRTGENQEGPVELRVTVNSKPYYINTGVRVRSDQFSREKVVNHRDARLLNERLDGVVMNIETAINECIRKDLPIDVAQIKRQAYNIEQSELHDETAMIDWIDEQIPLLKIKDGTRERYYVTARRMREYGGLMRWDDLTVENLYKWDAYLHGIKKPMSNGDVQAGSDGECIGDAAVYNYHRTLRSLLSRAVKLGIIETNVYDRVRGEFRKGIKENVEYLTEDEIAAIESLHPMPGTQMAMARDLFVFQMYTGLSYSDAQAFDIRDYKRETVRVNRTAQGTGGDAQAFDIREYKKETAQKCAGTAADGNDGSRWVHVGQRVKTGVAYVSVLLPQAVEVLERYGWQVPKVNNVQYNESLKVIQRALGIRTRLHSHLARHTFATRALSMGVKIENVSAMLGHTNITQTQRYAKVLAQSVKDEFEMMAEKMKGRR
jgi:integrase